MPNQSILSTTSSSTSDCISQAIQAAKSYQASLNSTLAFGSAVTSPQFVSTVNGNNYSFMGITPTYTYDLSNCSNLTLTGVALSYNLNNVLISGCGQQIPEGVQVSEDISLTQVTGIQIDATVNCQATTSSLMSSDVSPQTSGQQYYSGYHVWDDSSGVRKTMTYSTTYYYQPTVSNSGSYCKSGPQYECAMSIWSGIFNSVSGGELAQSGTAGTVPCPGGNCGTPTYLAWWEFLPGYAQQTCSNFYVYPGDQYEAIAENGPVWGGAQNQWQMYVVDENLGELCQSPIVTYTPTYYANAAETVFETPTVNGNIVPLPSFTTTTNTGNSACYTTNLCAGFSTYYDDGWGNYYLMQNNCNGQLVTNILLGTLSSNSFTSTFKNTCGT